MNQMRDLRRRIGDMEGANPILDATVCNSAPLVLPEMFDPGLDQKGLDVAARLGSIVIHAPLNRPIASPNPAQGVYRFHEIILFARSDEVLHRDQDRSLIYACLDLEPGLRPVQRRTQVQSSAARHRPPWGSRQPGDKGDRRNDQSSSGSSSRRDGPPDDPAQREAALEDEQIRTQRAGTHPRRHHILGGGIEAGHEHDPGHSPRYHYGGENRQIGEQRRRCSYQREHQRRRDEDLIERVLLSHALQERRTADGAKPDATQQETKSRRTQAKLSPRQNRQERPERAPSGDENTGADQDGSNLRCIPYVTQAGPCCAEYA